MASQLTLNQLVGSSSLPRLTITLSAKEPARSVRAGSLIRLVSPDGLSGRGTVHDRRGSCWFDPLPDRQARAWPARRVDQLFGLSYVWLKIVFPAWVMTSVALVIPLETGLMPSQLPFGQPATLPLTVAWGTNVTVMLKTPRPLWSAFPRSAEPLDVSGTGFWPGASL